MQDLKIWEEKIKEKRKNTEFRDFVKEIASWLPLSFYKEGAMISRYPIKKRIKKIIDSKKFEKELLNIPHTEYQTSKTFFENLSELYDDMPFDNMISFEKNENSAFADIISSSKNIYLSSNVVKWCENVAYSFSVKVWSRNIYNSFCVWNNSENIYQSMAIINSYNIFFSKFIDNSNNIYFSNNLISCKYCIFCRDLENAEYCWDNKKLTKEEYRSKIKIFLSLNKNNYYELYQKNLSYGRNSWSNNVQWSFIHSSENITNGTIVFQTKNARNIIAIWWKDTCENMYDCIACGSVLTSDVYWWIDSGWWDNIYCCNGVWSCSHLYYSQYLENCSFCLGCIWLKNKSFCILNKQYSKEEWYKLADTIFASMEKEGILWEFFPWSLNPFYFNDTMAYLIDDSFSKEEVEKSWYMWRDEKIKVDIPEWAEVVYVKNPPFLSDIPLNKGDSQSGADILEITPPTRSSLPNNQAEILTRHPELVSGSLKGKSPNYDSELNSEWQRNNSVSNSKWEILDNYQGFDSSGNWKINHEILRKVIVDKDGNYYKIVPMEYDFLMKYELSLPEIHWLERIKLGFKFQ
jgi:hypothetical protein